MTSEELKAEGMAWLRFVGKKFCVATEVGPWNADLLGIDEKSSIEIETKISKSDLRIDFDKRKHRCYADAATMPYEARRSPNRFYFLVPKELVDYATVLVEERAPRYGILALEDGAWGMHGRRLVVKRKAKSIHAAKPEPFIIRACMMRMSSELATLRYQLVGFKRLHVGTSIDEHLKAATLPLLEFLKGEVAWDPEPLVSAPFTEDELKILANLPPED